jgi:Tol biopolymer transport system component
LLLSALVLTYFQSRKASEPFAEPQFSRVTGDGTTGLAAISPNGEYIVYTTRKKGWTQIWRRKVGTSGSTPVIAPILGDAVSLEFTDNGNRLAFALHPALQTFHRNLFTVPLQGGAPVQILGELSGPVGISPDGTKAAIVRANRSLNRDELWIADLKQGGERLITWRQYPTHLVSQASPAWSRDGKLVAFPVETKDNIGFHIYLQTIEIETGQERRVQSPRWLWVEDIEWINGQSALAIVARPQGSSFKQIWYVGYPDGVSRRLGSDIDSYNSASVSEDGNTLAAIQQQTLTNIYVAAPKDEDHSVQVTPGTGRYFDLSWTSDDRILYATDSTGEAELWTIKGDGSEQRQITAGGGLKWAPVSSPDGKYIAYHSNISGSWNIWRADSDGSNPVQITQGPRDSNWPHFTPDSKFVLFHQTDPGGRLNLWKAPIEGGTPIQLTKAMTTHPAVSARDGKIVAWYSETVDHPQWKLAVFAPGGGEPLKVFTPSVAITSDSQLAWSPAGDAVTCLGQENGVWNVWNQPIDGRPAKRLTSFVSGQIYSFDWSKDGRLAFSHGVTNTDLVIVRDKRRKS